MNLKLNKIGIILPPPPHILANAILKAIHLKTQIAIHWLVVDSVRPLADCGLGFLFLLRKLVAFVARNRYLIKISFRLVL